MVWKKDKKWTMIFMCVKTIERFGNLICLNLFLLVLGREEYLI